MAGTAELSHGRMTYQNHITDVNGFETTAFYCLGAGILFSVPAILTGFLAWWLNYQLRPMRPVLIKIFFSALLVIISLAAFLLRIFLPDTVGIVYPMLLLILVPVVSVIGWYGASLTFPLEKK